MLGSAIEKSIYVKGLCQIVINHPLIDVDHFGMIVVPNYSKLSSVFSGLVTVRLQANKFVEDKVRKLASRMMPLVLFSADELRGVNAEQAYADFWKQNPKAELYRNMNRVTVRNFSHACQVIVGPCPLLQFVGTVSVKSAAVSGHRCSIQRRNLQKSSPPPNEPTVAPRRESH